jgi:uncharacterized repeat protein (TIGR03803 family)
MVFQLRPPATAGGNWTETALYSFGSEVNDGVTPDCGPIMDGKGNLYGTTSGGGSANQGTVWKLARPSTAGGEWTETVLYSFTGQNGDGVNPNGVIWGKNGALYGTTYGGGLVCTTFPEPPGCGTIFALSPPPVPGGSWTATVLYRFTGQNGDGATPFAAPAWGPNGALYGTTSFGGNSHNWGTIYQLTAPAAPGGAWTEKVLYTFAGAATGVSPYTPLTASPAGVLYGTTLSTVFQLLP